MRGMIALAALLLLAGCGSSPKTHFYTLDVVRGTGGQQAALAGPIQIAAVHIPAALDRRQMVRRTGTNAVDISDRDRWSAPLGRMARNVLSQDLAARLPKGAVVLPDAPAPAATRQIVVTIAAFGPLADGTVRLRAEWALLDGSPAKPVLRRNVDLQVSSGRGGAAVASAMSRLLGQLADRMAVALPAGLGEQSGGS